MKIVVLAGGISTERDVSLSTGAQILKALKTKKHDVVMIDAFLGNYVEVSNEDTIKEIDPDVSKIKAMREDGGKSFFGPGVIDQCKEADIVFIALHGEDGENGKVQAYLDLMGIKYTGTDYLSAGIAMDKAVSKEIMSYNGVRTPQGIHLLKGEIDKREVKLPCVVKTCCGGSSVGVYIVYTEEEYEKAKEAAFSYENEIVIEEYISGREFSVGVIDGKALPVIEIEPINGFYDYKNKYQPGNTIETCPANLSEELTRKLQNAAENAYRALRYQVYARVDFILSENGEAYCLEANTLPGMTPVSLLPQEAKVIGLSFPDLCEKLVQLSLKKYM